MQVLRCGHILHVYDEKLLFDYGRLREVEELELRDIYSSRQWDAREELDTWDSERLLATAEAEIVESLLARHSIVCPVLHRERAEQLPGDQDWLMTRLVIAVPFDGDADVFQVGHGWPGLLQAQTKKGDATEGELFLVWPDDASDEVDSPHEFNARLDKVEQQLSALGPGIARTNTDLSEWMTTMVASRREGLLAHRELATGLGIPIRKRADAAQFEVPLSEEQYKKALAALGHACITLERISREVTTHLGEEKIRDLVLGFLNVPFKGAAAGEVFNKSGKTDILIRVEDRNVFIAECKIWDGPEKFQTGLEQLLSYLTWRDDKAALVLFIRNGETSSIIRKAIGAIEGHPTFIRTLKASVDGEGCDFVFHANGDPSKEIRLALLPFPLLDRQ